MNKAEKAAYLFGKRLRTACRLYAKATGSVIVAVKFNTAMSRNKNGDIVASDIYHISTKEMK